MQELTIKQKLINYYYFVIFNSILACVIGVGYWFQGRFNIYIPTPKLTDWLDIFYIITTHFSIITLVVFAVSLAILPTIYLKPKKAKLIQFILFNVLLAILVCDVRVFQLDKIHLFSHAIMNLAEIITIISPKEAMFTVNKAIFCIFIVVFMLLIYTIKHWINKTNWLKNNKIGTIFTSLLLASSVISLLIYQLSTTKKQQQLLACIQYLPISNKNNTIANMYKQIKHGKLQYPLQSIQTTEVTNPPNILIIAMDAWRADCFNEQDSPNLWKFAEQGTVFINHLSSGNHTPSGLFGLFYGLPAIYRSLCNKYNQTALIFDRLKQLEYQINFFVVSSCNKNIIESFKVDPKLVHDNKGNYLFYTDKQATEDWLVCYNKLNNNKPWFSFLFYDSLHGPDFPDKYSSLYKPSRGPTYKEFANKIGKQGFINSYKTSVHYLDSLASQVLKALKQNNDLENTIVIITADHGCEWDDNSQGNFGYGSNFTDCQVKVPLAIILPLNIQNKISITKQVNYLTTHYDIAPTLMKKFLGVSNNLEDYSIGHDLTESFNNLDWSLATSAGKYTNTRLFAIIQKNQIISVNPNNFNYKLIDKFNNINFSNNKTSTDFLNEAIEYITRFIKK